MVVRKAKCKTAKIITPVVIIVAFIFMATIPFKHVDRDYVNITSPLFPLYEIRDDYGPDGSKHAVVIVPIQRAPTLRRDIYILGIMVSSEYYYLNEKGDWIKHS